MSENPAKRPVWASFLLVMLPVWLLASGGAALWYYFHREKQDALVEQARFARMVSIPSLEDDLRKITEVIGERHASSESAAINLGRTASMIEGLLGPSNTGYTVHRVRGPADWPLLHVTLRGRQPDAPAVWVVSSYDSKPGSPGVEANATGLTATVAAAQALAEDQPPVSIHFVWLPHANDPDSPVLETLAAFQQLAGNPKALLYVEAMGAEESLWLSSRDTAAVPLALNDGLGAVRGADVICLGDDTDLASLMHEMGLPAVRVATRPLVAADDPDDGPPSSAFVAGSTGRLVELIRRCAHVP